MDTPPALNIPQELIEIFHLIRHQEEHLYKLHQGLRAVTEILHKKGLGPEYEQSYEAKGSSSVALDYAETLQLIDETIRRLKEIEGQS